MLSSLCVVQFHSRKQKLHSYIMSYKFEKQCTLYFHGTYSPGTINGLHTNKIPRVLKSSLLNNMLLIHGASQNEVGAVYPNLL